jgi:prolyl-tRNA editing enzyme YbaK/EbsC (Cys-tRNA(Pro) deacylase)
VTEGLPPGLRQALDAAGVAYELLEHAATIHRAEDGAVAFGVALAQMAPTLILHTETGPLAATVSGVTRLSLKKVKKALGLRNVALAPRDEVVALTGAEPGIVALVNPGLPTVVDVRLLAEPWAYGGCGVPARTLKMRPADLVAVTGARVLDIAEDKPAGRAPSD